MSRYKLKRASGEVEAGRIRRESILAGSRPSNQQHLWRRDVVRDSASSGITCKPRDLDVSAVSSLCGSRLLWRRGISAKRCTYRDFLIGGRGIIASP